MKFFLIPCLLFTLNLHAERSADLSTLESLTSEWVALRAARAQEAESWRDEQARIRLETSLLEEAEARLLEEREQLQERGDETEAQQADLLAELETREASMAQLGRTAEASANSLENLLVGLPSPLLNQLVDERDSLESAGDDPLQRFRALLALRNRLLQLQTQLHVTPTLIDLDGQRREMDVLWIGTAHALAVSGDNTRAARGAREDGQWQWQPLHPHADGIRHAVRLVREEAPPALLSLPFSLPDALPAPDAPAPSRTPSEEAPEQ